MKAKTITYSRLHSVGNYGHVKIGIEIEVEEGKTADEAYETAKQFVVSRIEIETMNEYKASEILKNKEKYTKAEVIQAEKILSENESDLPF